jgi:hypothetical protein
LARRATRGAKKPGGGAIQTAGRLRKSIRALEYAEYDGADKSKRDIRGHNAQPGDERTKGHFQTSQVPTSQFTSQPALTHYASNAFHAKKVSFAVWPRLLGSAQRSATWLKRREIKTLMSP